MKIFNAILLVLLLGSIFPASSNGGVYYRIDLDFTGFEPFIVIHPSGYQGMGGELMLKVCAEDPDFGLALQDAMETWNELTPIVRNCHQCTVYEDPPMSNPEDYFYLTSVLMHELGHCAMGLGHTNWEQTSATATRAAASIDPGNDAVPGSRDDVVTPLPGARLVHWFRTADNNPIIVDNTTIDSSTYSRRIQDLPPGSNWAANGNKDSSLLLNEIDTHSLMYTLIEEGVQYVGLDADAVNTVKLGMSGIDIVAGTADDYTVNLELVDDCSTADIVIKYFTPANPNDLTVCDATAEQIDSGNVVHYRITPSGGASQLSIEINSFRKFDVIFADDFESGNLSRWTTDP